MGCSPIVSSESLLSVSLYHVNSSPRWYDADHVIDRRNRFRWSLSTTSPTIHPVCSTVHIPTPEVLYGRSTRPNWLTVSSGAVDHNWLVVSSGVGIGKGTYDTDHFPCLYPSPGENAGVLLFFPSRNPKLNFWPKPFTWRIDPTSFSEETFCSRYWTEMKDIISF